MPTFKLTIAYDGSAYAGWQWQLNAPSVQGAFEVALSKVAAPATRLTASGRTDAGVHAIAQVISFSTSSTIDANALRRGLNSHLPPDIVVNRAELAPDDFHAIRDAVRKRYRYVIHDGPIREVMRRNYCWHVRQRLNVEAMHRAAAAWLGRHDFASFQSANSRRLTTVRTVFDISVQREPLTPDFIHFEIEADGFLYNMVRTMVGTLAKVGRGRFSEAWPAEVMACCDRRQAGERAPAQGLFLLRVDYLPGNAHVEETADFDLQTADLRLSQSRVSR